jgi:hypothetical protein
MWCFHWVAKWQQWSWRVPSFILWEVTACDPLKAVSACYLFHVKILLGLLFDPEDWGDMFLRSANCVIPHRTEHFKVRYVLALHRGDNLARAFLLILAKKQTESKVRAKKGRRRRGEEEGEINVLQLSLLGFCFTSLNRNHSLPINNWSSV